MIKLFWHKSDDRQLLIEKLKQNNVFISSTDTIYGFLANTTLESYNKICELKKITEERRPLLILIHSPEKLSHFVDIQNLSEKIRHFVSKCWPGPVTFIFKAKPNAPSFLSSKENTIALRCPKHDGLQKILSEFDGLFSTSANIIRKPPPEKFSDINPEILETSDGIIVDEPEVIRTEPSTIIDLTQTSDDFPFKIVRSGAFSKESLEKLYKS